MQSISFRVITELKAESFLSFFQSGKVPKDFYITEEDSYNNTSTYQTVVVKKGSKLKLNFDVEESGVFLK